MARGRWGLVALLVLATVTCGEAPMTAPPGSTLAVFANPTFIVANGGVSVISASVIEPAGTTAPDGTVVLFFTSLGQIPPQGETKAGVARVNLVADSRSGPAQVTATSGDQTATVDLSIGSALPARVLVSADPAVMRSNAWSNITANVFDENGNPVANVPVVFSVTGSTETLDSGGRQLFTDTNGQVFDVLRSQLPLSQVGSATVTATTANGISGSVKVNIN
jgi:hypothetical protein